MHNTISNIKKAVWLYFILLLIEGGLRRWIFPGLASALILVREPVGIYLLIEAYNQRIFPKNKWISIIFLIGVVSIFTAIFKGHGNIYVALFGARILLIQFPVLFIIGQVFDRSDVIKLGKVILLVSIPMAVLITLQFYSPQTAWVNRGVANSLDGAGFGATADYFRPPGTFSFTTGVCLFFELAACFIFYFWLEPNSINKSVLIFSTLALVIAIPTCISRTLFFQAVLSFFCFIVATSTKPNFTKNLTQLIAGFSLIILLAVSTNALNTQVGAFTERFESANENEGGLHGVLIDRFLGGMVSAITQFDNDNVLYGLGIGIGTNAGAQMLNGKTGFLIAEQEWGRIMGESGLILGLMIIFIRISITLTVARSCLIRYRSGDYLPWMLLSFGFLLLLQGSWSQPNSLGFYVLTGGILIASVKNKEGSAFR